MQTRTRRKIKVKNVKKNEKRFGNTFHYYVPGTNHIICVERTGWATRNQVIFTIKNCDCEKNANPGWRCVYFSNKAISLERNTELFGCACGANRFDLLCDFLNFDDDEA